MGRTSLLRMEAMNKFPIEEPRWLLDLIAVMNLRYMYDISTYHQSLSRDAVYSMHHSLRIAASEN